MRDLPCTIISAETSTGLPASSVDSACDAMQRPNNKNGSANLIKIPNYYQKLWPNRADRLA